MTHPIFLGRLLEHAPQLMRIPGLYGSPPEERPSTTISHAMTVLRAVVQTDMERLEGAVAPINPLSREITYSPFFSEILNALLRCGQAPPSPRTITRIRCERGHRMATRLLTNGDIYLDHDVLQAYCGSCGTNRTINITEESPEENTND